MSTSSETPSAEVVKLRAELEELRVTDPAPKVAEAKARVADTVVSAAASAIDTASTAAAGAAAMVDRVAGPVREGVERVRGAVDSARTTVAQVKAQKESLSEQVRDQPFLALGIAIMTGYVLGRAVR